MALLSPATGRVIDLPSRGKTNGNCESSTYCNAILPLPLHFERNETTCVRSDLRICPMSAPLVVSIPHSLGREEAMRRLKAGLSKAATSVPVLSVDEERWEDTRMICRVRALGQ